MCCFHLQPMSIEEQNSLLCEMQYKSDMVDIFMGYSEVPYFMWTHHGVQKGEGRSRRLDKRKLNDNFNPVKTCCSLMGIGP